MTKRKKTINPLTEKQFVNFLKFVKDHDDVTAVEVFLEDLSEGKSVLEVLAGEQSEEGEIITGNSDPYEINVREIELLNFEIYLGCFPGPNMGDAGIWSVLFNLTEDVIEANQTEHIVS